MVYGSYRRTYRVRYARRRYRARGSTLSTRNIYARRSSLSQAGQIAALKRKVNKVYRACKPETKVVASTISDKTFSNSTFADTWVGVSSLPINSGTGDNQRIGNKVYRQDKYKMVLTYSNNASESSGLHNGETALGYLRVICGIWKEPKSQDSVPTAASVITSYGTTGNDYARNIIQPLNVGIGAEHKIWHDKVYKVDLTNPSKIVSIRSPWYSSIYDAQGYCVHSWMLIITGDLDWDTQYTEWVEMHGVRKTVFKDI